MIRSISTLAIFALLGASLMALPDFASAVKADEVVAFPKADRPAGSVVAGDCASQTWPNIVSSCLRDAASGATIREARLVTARR